MIERSIGSSNSVFVDREHVRSRICWLMFYSISQKVQIVVEHSRQHLVPLLNGKGKAMVVVASRVEAVRWQLAIDATSSGGATPLVRSWRSGEVNDEKSGPDPFTENSKTLNRI